MWIRPGIGGGRPARSGNAAGLRTFGRAHADGTNGGRVRHVPPRKGAEKYTTRPRNGDTRGGEYGTLADVDPLEDLLRLLPLEALPRTGWVLAGVPNPETVAAHTLGVALTVLALGPRVLPPLDVDRAVALAVVHDAPEALLGDLPKEGADLLPEGAKAKAEERAAGRLLGPLSAPAMERWTESQARRTREARFTHLCDKLQLGVRLVAYVRAGNAIDRGFRAGLEALDGTEFPPCEELRASILRALPPRSD